MVLRLSRPKLKSRLPCKSSSVNTSLAIDLTVTEGMNVRYLTHARMFDTRLYYPLPHYREPGYEATDKVALLQETQNLPKLTKV